MIENIHDLGTCMDIEQLKKQKEKYHAEIAEYCKVNPLCAAIIVKMRTDKDFLHFISLISVRAVFSNRIKELEDKTND